MLIALMSAGCAVTSQDLKQEMRDESRGAREQMERAEASYERREYQGLTSKESEHWNATDWSLWMNSQGGE